RIASGVFRHVLFPQDKEGFGSITSHEENCFVYTRSHRPPLTRPDKINGKKSVISTRYPSNPYTRRLLEKENRFFCVRCFSKELSLSCGRKGIGGTPQCVSTRRPTSRPRKA